MDFHGFYQVVHHMQLLRQALIYDHEGETLVMSPKQRDLRRILYLENTWPWLCTTFPSLNFQNFFVS
jgi:hypothetical protein